MLNSNDGHEHTLASANVDVTGVAYFAAWSLSFYPQIILNHRRKRTVGLSPEFIYLNPLGFLCLSIWSWAVYYSQTARDQYRARHDGHEPQVSAADLAFSLHAFIISSITLFQAWYYAARSGRKHSTNDARSESDPLLSLRDHGHDGLISTSPIKPGKPYQVGILVIIVAPFISAIMVWAQKIQLLDWLYFVSSIKLVISAVKYIPQIILNWKLQSAEGFAIGQILLDLTGSLLSFAQLVVSSVFVELDAGGIIANPVKLGLSLLSLSYDIIFMIQKYWVFRGSSIDPVEEQVQREA